MNYTKGNWKAIDGRIFSDAYLSNTPVATTAATIEINPQDNQGADDD